MNSLQKYLSSAKANKKSANLVVLGNESADLDSMVSSIAYGYLLDEQKRDVKVLPVMPIPRADFKLRPDAVYLFRKAGVDPGDLVFSDEIELETLMANGAGLVLVDHNRLSPAFEKYHANVVIIVDHHADEDMYHDIESRLIENAGSAASLVGREFRKTGATISKEIAILLFGTILLDTVNLDKKVGRVTDIDTEVIEFIFSLYALPRDEYFKNIQREKFNVTGLGTSDLLRKDYKEFLFKTVRCGISSVVLSIEQWKEKDSDLPSALVSFATTRKLDVLLVMNAYDAPEFQRDFVIYCNSQELYEKLFECLQKHVLDLDPVERARGNRYTAGYLSFYRQGNLDMSRKKLQPLLAGCFE